MPTIILFASRRWRRCCCRAPRPCDARGRVRARVCSCCACVEREPAGFCTPRPCCGGADTRHYHTQPRQLCCGTANLPSQPALPTHTVTALSSITHSPEHGGRVCLGPPPVSCSEKDAAAACVGVVTKTRRPQARRFFLRNSNAHRLCHFVSAAIRYVITDACFVLVATFCFWGHAL